MRNPPPPASPPDCSQIKYPHSGEGWLQIREDELIRLAGPFQNLVLPLPLCMSLDESLPLSELQLCPLQT